MRKNFDAPAVKQACVEWIRAWFAENGPLCNAVIGISGGKDSSVAAALCAEALGPARVIGVLMPDGEQPDIADSYRVVEALGIRYTVLNIGEAVAAVEKEIHGNTDRGMSRQAEINLPPRIRMATLYALSQSNNGRVVNTCNYSEEYVGYSTRWGDNTGDFSPLWALTTDEVVAIGLLCEKLPADLVRKVPSDGLCGQTDEDRFGFSYDQLNAYIHEGSDAVSEEIRGKIEAMHSKNLFKQKPIPYFPL